MRIRLALALVVMAMMSGCASATAGASGSTVRVHVTDEPGGPGLSGVVVEASEDCFFSFFFSCYRASATTDANGDVTFRAPAVLLISASAPGHTAEQGRRNGTTLELPLYKDHLSLDLRGTLNGADVSAHDVGADDRWSPQEVPFAQSAEGRKGYIRRALSVNATLTWTNEPLAAGDLALGLSPENQRVVVWQDSSDQQLGPGEHQESVRLTVGTLDGSQWRDAITLYVGPGPGKAYAAPTPLAWAIHLEGVFGAPRNAPTTLVWGTLLALVTAAMILRPTSGRRP
ncbi:MAG: hypothetical protein WDA16_03700 [Candidatus Thermoplasmatota archaeon]